MKSIKSPVSLLTAVAFVAHALMLHMVVPAPAYALTQAEAKIHWGRIAAGDEHSLSVMAGGTVEAWGADSALQSTVPNVLGEATRVAAGGAHSLALRTDGTVLGWGEDSTGQSTVPSELSGVVSLAAGGEHSLALKSDGTVVAWGSNGFGQSSVPMTLGDGVVAIAAGGDHSLALKGGTVVAWGNNEFGQATVPTSALSGVVAIAAGGYHSLALKSDGTVVGWGKNHERQILIPSGLTNVVAIAAGFRHSVALKSDGTVVAWGGLLDGSFDPSVIVPTGLGDVVAISAGRVHSLALKSDGTTVGWGDNRSGQAFGVVSVDPQNDTVGAPVDTIFTISYSAPLQAAANYNQVSLKDRNGNAVAFSKSLSGRVLTVQPTGPLATDNRYTLSTPSGSVKDAYGTNSVGQSVTVWTPDTIPPAVVSVSPAHGAEGVSVHRPLNVEFTESIAQGDTFGSITLQSDTGDPVECMYSTLQALLVITPMVPLESETLYTLTIPAGAVTDKSDNPLAIPFTSNFTTGLTHTITTTAGVGGSISPSGAIVVDRGASKTFTVAATTGYEIDAVLVDGEPVTLVDNTYTFVNVTADHAIGATFVKKTYTLAYAASAGGSISGTAFQTVAHGSDGEAVTAEPDPGHVFIRWSDGVTAATRTDTNVTADITVQAEFATSAHAITATAGAGGSIAPAGAVFVGNGASQTFTVTADEGHEVDAVLVDGEPVTLVDNTYTFVNVTADHAIGATFALKQYTLLYSASAGGTISGSTRQIVSHGFDGTAVTAEPKTGYTFAGWSDGVTTATRTDRNVKADRSVRANFASTSTPTPSVSIAGDNRYLTAIAGSRAAFDRADAVVIATGEHFADALGGAGLAGALDAPLLLTQKGALPSAVATEIGRLGASKAYILGGAGAVSDEVGRALDRLPGVTSVIRIAGNDRYQTASAVAAETIKVLNASGTYNGDAFIATGANFPDALCASPVAASQGMPVFLADPARPSVNLPASVKRVWITGGTAVVSTGVENSLKSKLGTASVKRLAGGDRFATAAAVARFGVGRGMTWDGVGITTGMNFPDALAAGPVLGSRDAVMLLTDSNSVPGYTRSELTANKSKISKVTFFGGDAAVPPGVRATVNSLIE